METLSLTVNGVTQEITCDPSTPLLYILRNDLGLTGAKLGCGLEQCGA
ncbi:MAG: (2Fe-2S)-binding protein, partial [Rhodospirillaceae bacterium TMED63]